MNGPNKILVSSIAALMATTILSTSGTALAQEAGAKSTDNEIIVTAQKREQNLQDVPISVQALGESRLENAQVASFDD